MVVVVAVGHISSLKAIRQVKEPVPLTADLKVTYLSEILYKLETVSIAEPLQNRQHAQNP